MSIAELVEPVRADFSYLDHCMDVDGHEMAPVHKWTELFGEGADEFLQLCSKMEMLADSGHNSLIRPDVEADEMAVTELSVWNERGCQAPGAFDLARRVDVMDTMGVDRQLVYPGFGFVALQLAFHPDAHEFFGFDPATVDKTAMVRRAIRCHNDWCVTRTRETGARVRPVGLMLTDSVKQMMDDAQELIDAGVRAVFVPNGVPPAGLSPADAALDPFWNLFAKARVPVTFHIGTEWSLLRSTAWDRNVPAFASALSLEANIQPFWGATLNFASENYLTAMILGGVLERHPTLRVGSLEVGANWVGPFAERIDLWAAQFKSRLKPILSMKPSEYINRQVRAAPFHFEDVASYFRRFPHLQDVYCFATDYPHIEGGRETKKKFIANLDGADEVIKRKFFRENGLLLLPD